MPFYDYKCTSCGHTFELSLLMKDREKPEKQPCPECGESTVFQYLPSAAAICDPVRVGVRKPDKGFREVQQKIAETHKNHSMNVR